MGIETRISKAAGLDRYKSFVLIGIGSKSNVYRAVHVPTCQDVAIKELKLEEGDALAVNREINALKTLNDPFVAALYEVIEDEDYVYIVMEYQPHGNFLQLTNNVILDEQVCKVIFVQILSAISKMHDVYHIVHRDIKPENLLLDANGLIRIIDFGFSREFDQSFPIMETACGSVAYTAPEVVEGKKYTVSLDIWSLGVLLYSMCTGKLPFYGINIPTMIKSILNEEPEYPSTMNPLLVDLLKNMMNKNNFRRITAKEIMNHPWIEDVKDFLYISVAPVTQRHVGKYIAKRNLPQKEEEVIFRILNRMKTNELLPDALSLDTRPWNDLYKATIKRLVGSDLLNSNQMKPKAVKTSGKSNRYVDKVQNYTDPMKTPLL